MTQEMMMGFMALKLIPGNGRDKNASDKDKFAYRIISGIRRKKGYYGKNARNDKYIIK